MKCILRFRYHFGFYRLDKPFLKYKLPKLTTEEKVQIKKTWPGLDISRMDYIWSRILKKEHGFSPYFIGALWNQDIDKKVNPTDQVISLENKALCDVYFPQIKFPEPFVRGLNGSLFDKEMRVLSMDQAVNLLRSKTSFIIKPSIGSMQGKGVKKIDVSKCDSIEKVLKQAGRDFIAQEVLCQHPLMASMNETSLNCYRVTSMYFNGRFDYAAALKIGKRGSIMDNWNSSYWVGVSKDGVLQKYGYAIDLSKVEKSDNGFIFEGVVLPAFKKMIEFVEITHKSCFPNCGIIGWDITIDTRGEVRVIETNLKNPGTQIEQLCSGHFFEPFRDDICNLLNS